MGGRTVHDVLKYLLTIVEIGAILRMRL